MLKRILDITNIDIDNPNILSDLENDLERMNHLKHEEMPSNVDTYLVKILPSTKNYMPGFYRFRYVIQYGNMIGNNFKEKGEKIFLQTEMLPQI